MALPGTFKLVTDYTLQGDQPQAVEALASCIEQGQDEQVLLGVTGSGKTFTMANVIARINRPALVLAPNKTLAAQLYNEFRGLFPENAVRYFVSYYDYYQPEAYVPSTDTYIEKDASINDEIDKLRHSATSALLERNDVLIVASVSCIFGLGSPEEYFDMLLFVEQGMRADRDEVLRKLAAIQYRRSDYDFHRGSFRVRGDVVEVFPVYEDERAVRIEFFDDTVEAIREIDPVRGTVLRRVERHCIYPASHYVTSRKRLEAAIEGIRQQLGTRLAELRRAAKMLEAQRLEQRTLYDIELLAEMGTCPGIENYSRHLTGRAPGETPPTLLHYFPDEFLTFIDESHVTVSQVGGMYRGDRSRKETLVEFGFRLPSALDNRPLKFEEFDEIVGPVVYVSATPGEYELGRSGGVIVEQLVRPTGLVDPQVEIRPAGNQVDDLLEEVRRRVEREERVLVTTLTKKMAEDLTDYYREIGVRVRYLHSDIETLERAEIIRDLRKGVFDVLVGINLLREGLDLPEVSLVAVLDADKEGFLRSSRSLIQTMGRASRNLNGTVILYADVMTDSMRGAIAETDRRREIQERYNREHGITPRSVTKALEDPLVRMAEADYAPIPAVAEDRDAYRSAKEIRREVETLRKDMRAAAERLDFERAAELRDRARRLEDQEPAYVADAQRDAAAEQRTAELRAKVDAVPTRPGVYLFKDARGKVIYVGKAKSLRDRLRSYFNLTDYRYQIRFLMDRAADFQTLVTTSNTEALILENNLIKQYKPRYNVRLKDDKSYLSVKVTTKDEWPRIFVTRNIVRDGNLYLGPYGSAAGVRDTLDTIRKVFPLRTCSNAVFRNRARPCLEYQIKRCLGPCVLDVDRAEYERHLQSAIRLLEGKTDELRSDLEARMREASGEERFEDAAHIRDRIAAVERVAEKQKVVSHGGGDRDVFGYWREAGCIEAQVLLIRAGKLMSHNAYQFEDFDLPDEEVLSSLVSRFYEGERFVPDEVLLPFAFEGMDAVEEYLGTLRGRKASILVPQRGEKRRLVEMAIENSAHGLRERTDESVRRERTLEQLQKRLGLANVPKRIECFDVSHVQGDAVVASMVAFDEALPDKKGYRRYKLRGVQRNDDFAAMKEVLSRRLTRGKQEGGLPDLIVVDGGKGQLAMAGEAMKELGVEGVELAALAKERVARDALSADIERKEDRVYRPGRMNHIALRRGSDELHLLQQIRDEAHRFAITFHRKLRSKRRLRSALDDVHGVGPAKRRALLAHFGSLKRVREASLDELASLPGIGSELAVRIREAIGAVEPPGPAESQSEERTVEVEEEA